MLQPFPDGSGGRGNRLAGECQGIVVPQKEQGSAGCKHWPGRKEQEIIKRLEVFAECRQGRNAVEYKNGAIGPGFHYPCHKREDKRELGCSHDVKGGLTEPSKAVERTEHFGGMIWLYKLVQGPEQEDGKNTETQQQQGER
eukprot:gnl/TRDRNA2_/TRDRNA2_52466_c1_seq1.p1 gnl/TRDRNA2_/TRDRNA2_52466_c1~~gnl/TRDRNA2_/TRDRNA2_52466_c1_seq1.p1  ORF type:complete len:141 (+),score=5.24 gnl/TRDRNA2_/TRDRNA2_52466_c1_seq1:1-423(+)